MAFVPNPRKVFNFIIEVAGLPQFEAQKVTLPEVEMEKVAHGDTNHDIKTAGRIIVPDLVIEKLRPAPGADNWAWDWFRQAGDILIGGGALPIAYKRIVVVKEMDASGLVTLNRHIMEGVWPTKISKSDLDRISSDNLIETITLSVDTYEQL